MRGSDVEHDEVELLLVECLERLLSVERLDDLVALLLKRIGEQLLNRLLVVNEEDAYCPVGPLCRSGLCPASCENFYGRAAARSAVRGPNC